MPRFDFADFAARALAAAKTPVASRLRPRRLVYRARLGLPALLALLLAGAASPLLADGTPPEIDLQRARALSEQAKALRDLAENDFRATEPTCYERVLVNRCLDQARQLRLDRIREARALEIEARRIELADRQRQAQEQGLTDPAPTSERGIPQPTPIPQASPDARVIDIRQQREAAAAAAETQAARERREADAQREESRARAERAAARRAEQAARDRERYDARIRKREETTGTIR